MKLRVLWVGKTQQEWVKLGIEEYAQRIRRYLPLEIAEAKEEKGTEPEVMRRREGERLEKVLGRNGAVILLDERGEEPTSPGFASLLASYRDRGAGELSFVIGGAYGFSDDLRRRADKTLALSRMTFTHQMVRPFLLEQIYRGLTILNNEQYHH